MAAIDWIPPAAKPALRRWLGKGLQFQGRYDSWDTALQHSAGYADRAIIERAVRATRIVIEGKAVAERDGTILGRSITPWFVIAGLASASPSLDLLRVIDFGGALGTVYRAVAPFVPAIESWTVIEQPAFVDAGAEFGSTKLKFASTFEKVQGPSDVVLFSSVLQYLPDYETICAQAVASGAKRIIIDRSPFSDRSAVDMITVQKTRAARSESYPCRIFGADFLARTFPGWRVIGEQMNDEGWHRGPDGPFCFRGYILDREQQS